SRGERHVLLQRCRSGNGLVHRCLSRQGREALGFDELRQRVANLVESHPESAKPPPQPTRIRYRDDGLLERAGGSDKRTSFDLFIGQPDPRTFIVRTDRQSSLELLNTPA